MKPSPKPKRAAAPRRAAAKTRTPKTPEKTQESPLRTPPSGRKASAPAKKAQKPSARAAPAPSRTAPRRADYGAPIDGFFAKQPPDMRVILETLRTLVEEVAPDATASLKWGMPNYAIGRAMMCVLAGHKAHVNLILVGPPQSFADPDGRLSGEGKGGRHLTLRTLEELPRKATRAWLRTAAQRARAKETKR